MSMATSIRSKTARANEILSDIVEIVNPDDPDVDLTSPKGKTVEGPPPALAVVHSCSGEQSIEGQFVSTTVPSNHLMTKKNNNAVHYNLCLDLLFWIRISLLFLSIFLLFLSTVYCMAQLIETKLDIISICDDPKNQTEIWRNSYLSSLRNGGGEVVIDEESQYGWTTQSCMTTRPLSIDDSQLWYSNKYEYHWKSKVNAKCVLFGLLSLFLVAIVFLVIFQLGIDILSISHGTLHTKSSHYQPYIDRIQSTIRGKKKNSVVADDEMKTSTISKLKAFYLKYFANDTTVWFIMKMLSEISELFIQSQAFLVYAGYGGDSLAHKPGAIVAFAILLSINAMSSGFLWFGYGVWNRKCFGLLYKRLIFFVDKFSDIFYTLYPFYVVLSDDYNQHTNTLFALCGQLNFESTSAYLAAYVPMFFLVDKCLVMVLGARKAMLNDHFNRWKLKEALNQKLSANDLLERVDSAGFQFSPDSLRRTGGSILDDEGNVAVSILSVRKEHDMSWIDRVDDEDKNKKIKSTLRRILVITFSLILIAFGLLVVILTLNHTTSAEEYCHSVTESMYFSNGTMTRNLDETDNQILRTNPELFVMDNCIYKVYPFTDDEQYRCQCRVFVIDWDEDLQSTANQREEYFNLTQPVIMNGVMTHWFMLEKMKTTGDGGDSSAIHTPSSEWDASWMKAMEWTDAYISNSEYGMIKYQNLEYLVFTETVVMGHCIVDLKSSPNLEYLSLKNNAISDLSEDICTLNNLAVLSVSYEPVESVPDCIGSMDNLIAIWLDILPNMESVPLSMFDLPNLLELSLFNGNIGYQTLIQHNVPNISNDTDALEQWFEDNFKFDFDRTDYWLSLQPICYENSIDFPAKLSAFLTVTCSLGNPCAEDGGVGDAEEQFCPPRLLGDGYCDSECILDGCTWDFGDCSQLCFAPELTNCSLALLENEECDSGCNNIYCYRYKIGSSNFGEPTSNLDMGECNLDAEEWQEYVDSTGNCTETVSIYLDENVPLNEWEDYPLCQPSWIGDGTCEDSCMSEECSFDGGDCDDGCGARCEQMHTAWNYFADGVHEVNHTEACGPFWEKAKSFIQISDTENCTFLVKKYDLNDDDYLNFREFQVVGGWLADQDIHIETWLNLNCSDCLDFENYNPTHQY